MQVRVETSVEKVHAEQIEQISRPCLHRRPVDTARPARLPTNEHVLGEGQIGKEAWLLVDDSDTLFARAARG